MGNLVVPTTYRLRASHLDEKKSGGLSLAWYAAQGEMYAYKCICPQHITTTVTVHFAVPGM